MFLTRFLRDHPEYMVLSNLTPEQREKLLWAREEGYIPSTKAPDGTVVFTEEQLDVAEMWWEKMHDDTK